MSLCAIWLHAVRCALGRHSRVDEVPVSIGPFLEGQFFEPQLIETMSQALADATANLGLTGEESATARFLATRIIKEARAGGARPWGAQICRALGLQARV